MTISEMVEIYFPADKYDDEVRKYAQCLAENVERQTRQKAVSAIFDLANKVHNAEE